MNNRLLIVFLILTLKIFGQNQQVQIANEYFNKADYEKAAVLYEKLIKKNDQLEIVYENYRTSLLKLSEEEKLKKFINGVKKKNPDSYKYQVDYILTFKSTDAKNYEKNLQKLIIKSKYDLLELDKLASAFTNRQLYNSCIQLYSDSRQIQKNVRFAHASELASLYKFVGQKNKMIDEYINLTIKDPRGLTFIQNSLQSELEERDYDYLESQLYQRLDEQSISQELAKLLTWYYIQKNDFYNAFVQARSTDKKLMLHGKELFKLGALANKNRDYKAAVKIYGHISKTYDDSYTYLRAQKLLIQAKEKQLKSTYPIDTVGVLAVIDDYDKLLPKMNRPQDRTEVLRSKALLYAFYLHENDSAIALLNTIIKLPRTSRDLLAKSKLDLGDIYLLNGEPWESTLLYSQVEKMIKDDRLGHLAKLKNAKLAFYKGDFELAQAYLDVLKLATTREIANDAMDLSILIQDNLGLDTTDVPLRIYSRADLLVFQKNFPAAQLTLDSLIQQFPNHGLLDEVLWLKAAIAYQISDYTATEGFYQQIITKYSGDILGDDAIFKLAELYEYHLEKRVEAQELYKQILMDFPGSIYVAEARKRYRQLRGDRVN